MNRICIAVLLGAMGVVASVAAAGIEDQSSPTPLILVKTDRTVGVCSLVQNPMRETAFNGIGPIAAARNYFRIVEHSKVSGPGVVTVLKNPEHGTLKPRTDAPGGYLYLPEVDYFGSDRATFQVEVDGKKIKVEYFFKVLQGVADDYTEEQYKNLCPNGNYWKISSTLDDDGNLIVTSVDYQSPTRSQGDVDIVSSTVRMDG